jgi:protease-4
MGKFLLGVLTGAVLIVLFGIIGFFAVASLRARPADVADGSTLILHLKGDVPEVPPVQVNLPFLPGRDRVTVQQVWAMLRRAAVDPRIKAVVLEPEDLEIGWAKMQEIHTDLEQFRKSGKPLVAYLKAPGLREYYVATAASKIYLPPAELLNVKGLGFELMYFRNTLNKLGVEVDVEHAGKYKDYGDMFTRTSMSPETKEVMNSLADNLFGDLVGTIARARNKTPEAVKALIDNGPFLAKDAKQNRLVDELRFEDEVFGETARAIGRKDLKKIGEREYSQASDASAGMKTDDRIAWVTAEGSITRGSADSDGDNGIESEAFDRILSRVSRDSHVKAVIVRINSPGGEVMASDDLWRAMNDLSKKKPVVISMSDDAASGGYYMAMSGDPLVAYPGTITGSIGVVFGKPNLHGLYDKLGINKDSVARGRFARIDSDYESLDSAGRQKLREGIDSEYEDFVSKVSAARHKPPEQVRPLAEGRVWLGSQAKDNGLVDELGGIDKAIEIAKVKAKIPSGSRVGLTLYPAKRTLMDVLFRSSDDETDLKAMAAIAGLDSVSPLRKIFTDSNLRVAADGRLRVWMRGGMLRMMPFAINFR